MKLDVPHKIAIGLIGWQQKSVDIMMSDVILLPTFKTYKAMGLVNHVLRQFKRNHIVQILKLGIYNTLLYETVLENYQTLHRKIVVAYLLIGTCLHNKKSICFMVLILFTQLLVYTPPQERGKSTE